MWVIHFFDKCFLISSEIDIVFTFGTPLSLLNCIIKQILPLNSLARVVKYKPRPQLKFIKAQEPIDEGAVFESCRFFLSTVWGRWRPDTWDLRQNGLLFIRMHNFFVDTSWVDWMAPILFLRFLLFRLLDEPFLSAIILCCVLIWYCGWHEEFLYSVHESAKDKCSKHDKHQRRRYYKVIIFTTKATNTCFLWAIVIFNLKNQGESDSAADHSSVCDKKQFVKLDSLLLEAKPAAIKGAQHADYSTGKNN